MTVTPTIKNGNKENPGNSRPISLLLIPGKAHGKLILDTISNHMKDNKVSSSSQQRRNA